MPKNRGQRIHEASLEEFFHGRKSAIGPNAAVQLVEASTPVERGVQLKAHPDNTGIVYVGKASTVTADSADATDGYPLEAGDPFFVPVDDVNKVWLIGSAGGQKVFWLGV